jgi:hypothetical protein
MFFPNFCRSDNSLSSVAVDVETLFLFPVGTLGDFFFVFHFRISWHPPRFFSLFSQKCFEVIDMKLKESRKM